MYPFGFLHNIRTFRKAGLDSLDGRCGNLTEVSWRNAAEGTHRPRLRRLRSTQSVPSLIQRKHGRFPSHCSRMVIAAGGDETSCTYFALCGSTSFTSKVQLLLWSFSRNFHGCTCWVWGRVWVWNPRLAWLHISDKKTASARRCNCTSTVHSAVQSNKQRINK